ncbi:MAG: hypothetical protein ABI980_13980 [Nitrospirota bacterium]
MATRTRSTWLIAVIYAGTLAAGTQATSVEAADANNACGLLTASEIESVLGTNVALDGIASMPGGNTQICMGQAASARVMLRLVTGLNPGRDRSGSKEKAGMEVVKQMGGQVEVKLFGPIVCSTVEPPASKPYMGYHTTCTVSKDTAMAGIEVTANNKKDMVPIERLRPLAEKMAGRF